MYNFISHIYDYVPKDFNFGGGFTIMRFSLGVLYEQFLALAKLTGLNTNRN